MCNVRQSHDGISSSNLLTWKLPKMKLAFVFTGHGTQRWDMGRQLLEEEPLFRETIEECDQLAPWSRQ